GGRKLRPQHYEEAPSDDRPVPLGPPRFSRDIAAPLGAAAPTGGPRHQPAPHLRRPQTGGSRRHPRSSRMGRPPRAPARAAGTTLDAEERAMFKTLRGDVQRTLKSAAFLRALLRLI